MTVRVRVPTGIGVDRVTLRVLQDGEPFYHSMTATAAGRHETWWTGEVEVHNPVTSYRFHTDGPAGYGWLTATGWHRGRDVLDAGDFLLSSYAGPPDWAADAIVLQVFPDRFARSAGAESRPMPDWAVPTPWDDPIVAADGRGASLAFGRQFYGGDLFTLLRTTGLWSSDWPVPGLNLVPTVASRLEADAREREQDPLPVARDQT